MNFIELVSFFFLKCFKNLLLMYFDLSKNIHSNIKQLNFSMKTKAKEKATTIISKTIKLPPTKEIQNLQ